MRRPFLRSPNAATMRSLRCPTTMRTSVICGGSAAIVRSSTGRPATSTLGFGRWMVRGRSRVPSPAAMMTAWEISLFGLSIGCGADRVHDVVDVAVHDALEVVPRFLDPVVGHAVLWEIVRPDLLGTFPAADLVLAQLLLLGHALLLFDSEEARAEDAHGAFLVLGLGPFVLAL